MDKNKFKVIINNNEVHYLLKYCYNNLTEEQKDKAFDNAISNNQGHHIFKFGYEKLTEEQKKIKHIMML
jgi:hypothetical protein